MIIIAAKIGQLETTPEHHYKLSIEALEGSGHAQVDINNRTVEIWRSTGRSLQSQN